MSVGIKHDHDKLRVELLPVGALESVAAVLTHGAKKYKDDNWQYVMPRRRYYGAGLRHVWRRVRGEKLDKESGLPHLAHAACCILFLLSFEVGLDNQDTFEGSNITEDWRCGYCGSMCSAHQDECYECGVSKPVSGYSGAV